MPKRSRRSALTITITFGASLALLVGFVLAEVARMPVWVVIAVVIYSVVVVVVSALISSKMFYTK